MASFRVVLISGCSTGIGLETAVLLAKDPEKRFKVYATMRNLDKKTALENEGKDALGDTLIIKAMDVSSDESVKSAVEEIIAQEGKIDDLINNAGVGCVGVLECMPMDQVKQLFEVNFFGALRLIQAVLSGMKARESGYIVNVSSMAGELGGPFNDIYCASKFALGGLTESLAPVLRQFKIKISLVEPGPVGTSFFANIQNIDSSTADQKTVQLMKNWFNYIKGALGPSISQKGEEIAQCIKEVLLSEKPHYRYLTNDKCFVEQISAKLADFSGDKLQEIMGKHCFGQNE
ncbi:unnamed protein product [Pocillopora meandrina]|uniref:Retinol dehydrogenase 8-like n=1 Tax=Pocillopora meandrina TaxID=46732 RepID=A0AAU9XCT0_9CNID|nr:unnamed protein product [Pocillopora meandrina]